MSVPTFFVPAETPETYEAKFAKLAKFAGKTVPPLSERIYSITFDADGVLEEWTATVGKSLRGHRRRITRPRGRKKFELVPQLERLQPLSDRATVLAIFEAVPYVVVTNKHVDPTVRSIFENPFLAGQPKSVTHFTLA